MRTLSEYILDKFAHSYLFEMARSRADFKDRIADRADILRQHVAMLAYCKTYMGIKRIDTEKHWLREVRAVVGDVYMEVLKKKSDAVRTRTIRDTLINDCDIYRINEHPWDKVINMKLKEEGLQLDTDRPFIMANFKDYYDKIMTLCIDTMCWQLDIDNFMFNYNTI